MRRLGLALALVVVPGGLWGGARPATDDATIVHVLNRLTWGPRPGDLDAVRATGLERWLDRQLHPDRIDDSAAEKRLASLETHGLSSGELLKGYELPREAKREIQKRRAELDESAERDGPEAGAARARPEVRAADAGQPAAGDRRAAGGQAAARRLLRAPARRGDGRLLAQPLQRLRRQGPRRVPGRRLRARRRSAPMPRAASRTCWGRPRSSPAMLFYLDNWLASADADAGAWPRRIAAPAPARRRQRRPTRAASTRTTPAS